MDVCDYWIWKKSERTDIVRKGDRIMTNRRVFIAELQDLTNEVICMGNALEIMISKVEKAIKEGNVALAQEIVESDDLIDAMECKIEKECIELIAKQQPVASDLRRVSACMRLIGDMERIGDHCSDICEYVCNIAETNMKIENLEFYRMFDEMRSMVHNTIKCFAKADVQLAADVMATDDVVDAIFASEVAETKKMIQADPSKVEYGVNYLLILKYIERMADHAGNIAEWVQYLVNGKLEETMLAE